MHPAAHTWTADRPYMFAPEIVRVRMVTTWGAIVHAVGVEGSPQNDFAVTEGDEGAALRGAYARALRLLAKLENVGPRAGRGVGAPGVQKRGRARGKCKP
jgi:hypothetical protein